MIEDKPAIWPYLLLSLIIHAILFAIAPWVAVPERVAGKEEVVVPVEFVTEDQARLRIADIAKPEVEKKPEKAKFLGMYDSSVSEEVVGTTRRPGTSGERAKSAARQEKVPKMPKAPKAPKGDRLFALDNKMFGGKSGPSELSKSPGEGGSFDDFYPDFRRGAHTYLNVHRYPDVEYFVRLKRAFKVAFNPSPSLRDFFAFNQVARGSVDVVLGVSVDRSGSLSELFIFRSSGIPSYDNEAMRTVRVSAPFSSPPAKFVEDDGLLRMSWTFSVYL